VTGMGVAVADSAEKWKVPYKEAFS
jgi:hypothetical protein